MIDRQYGGLGQSRITAAPGGSESRLEPKLALFFSRSSVGLLQAAGWLISCYALFYLSPILQASFLGFPLELACREARWGGLNMA